MISWMRHRIHLEGHLDEEWSDWLNGSVVVYHDDGTTTVTRKVKEQAALFGLLIKIRDLGVPLISVNRVEPPKEQ
ncbi:hypothetical protein KFU94_65305 [Chloroflexi bacterium TSY]|nr:hypothetical protein [Chloroflexi bacterium TSY]